MRVAITVVVDVSDPSSRYPSNSRFDSIPSPLVHARSEVDRWLCVINANQDCYGIDFDLGTLTVAREESCGS
jgi:hypothetical protein